MELLECTAAPQRYDARGRKIPANRKSRKGMAPRTKGRKFPPQALTNADVEQLLRSCGRVNKHTGGPGRLAAKRLRCMIAVAWRSGLRISELLDLEETDLDFEQRKIVVRRGKGGKRRIVGMDDFGWAELRIWMELRREIPPGKLFPVLTGVTAGNAIASNAARASLRACAVRAGVRKRVHWHGLRHAFTVGSWRDDVDIVSISRQLGHARVDITQAYLVTLGEDELLTPIMDRPAPLVPLTI